MQAANEMERVHDDSALQYCPIPVPNHVSETHWSVTGTWDSLL